jgi:hypothetical protein
MTTSAPRPSGGSPAPGGRSVHPFCPEREPMMNGITRSHRPVVAMLAAAGLLLAACADTTGVPGPDRPQFSDDAGVMFNPQPEPPMPRR